MRDLDHVSYERVLSGAGLYRVFQFVVERAGAVEPEWVREVKERGDRPQDEISRAAAENRCALSQEAVGLFVRVFGAEAGNLALRFLATGGVFLGGGVAPKMLGALQGQGFLEAFRAKGRMRPLLEAVPVMVIRNEFTALFGAARFASEAGRGG
jgi:glucokinase